MAVCHEDSNTPLYYQWMLQALRALVPRTACLIAFAACLTGTSISAYASPISDRISAQKLRVQETNEHLATARRHLSFATVRLNALREELARTNAAIVSARSNLELLESQATALHRRMLENSRQLAAARKSLALHEDAYDKRLVDIYEHGDIQYISVLLGAKSFSDLTERWHDLQLLAAADQRVIQERKVAADRVKKAQISLESANLDVQAQMAAVARQQNALSTLQQEKRDLVAVADRKHRQLSSMVVEMEDLSAAQEAQLEAMIVEREKEIAAQQEAERRAAMIAGKVPAPVLGAPSALSWPVSGVITSPFGYRQNPFGGGLEFHKGLDIAAAMGTTVTAAAPGTVISAGWYGGYGNFILIDMGGGLAAGYAHLSQIFVAEGQHVDRGQAIGAVGSTGESTGPHLHFEVRLHGSPVNPVPYLHN